MKSLRGQFLVASPHLGDANFYHTVVLMIQHDQQGAFGLVVNRPSDTSLKDVWQQVDQTPCASSQPLFLGGPIEGPLMAIHTRADSSDAEILPDLHFATQREHLQQVVGREALPFRVFTGYAGWAPGQLDGEMEAGGWLTLPATAALAFFDPSDELWQEAVHRIGGEILGQALRRDDLPGDVSMN